MCDAHRLSLIHQRSTVGLACGVRRLGISGFGLIRSTNALKLSAQRGSLVRMRNARRLSLTYQRSGVGLACGVRRLGVSSFGLIRSTDALELSAQRGGLARVRVKCHLGVALKRSHRLVCSERAVESGLERGDLPCAGRIQGWLLPHARRRLLWWWEWRHGQNDVSALVCHRFRARVLERRG